MKKYRGVIFDLDGTLLDTIDDISDSMNDVLKQYSHPTFTSEEYKLKIGGGFKNLALNSFPKGTLEEIINESIELFANMYDKRYMNKSKPYEGIDELLDILVDKDIKLGVNSNKRNDYTNNLVNNFFQRIPFVSVYGECKGIPTKPDPTLALKIIKAMDLKPEEILYVGDTNTDMMTAQNAGIDSVGVLWGFRSYEELKKYDAKYIISKPDELLDII